MKYGLIVIIQEEKSKQCIENPKTNHRKEHLKLSSASGLKQFRQQHSLLTTTPSQVRLITL